MILACLLTSSLQQFVPQQFVSLAIMVCLATHPRQFVLAQFVTLLKYMVHNATLAAKV